MSTSSPPVDPYGEDIAFSSTGDIVVTASGSLAAVAGAVNCAQAVFLRMLTPLGDLALHPGYGSQIAGRLVGAKANITGLTMALNADLQQLLADDARFVTAKVSSVQQPASTVPALPVPPTPTEMLDGGTVSSAYPYPGDDGGVAGTGTWAGEVDGGSASSVFVPVPGPSPFSQATGGIQFGIRAQLAGGELLAMGNVSDPAPSDVTVPQLVAPGTDPNITYDAMSQAAFFADQPELDTLDDLNAQAWLVENTSPSQTSTGG